ncbi:hypothetical protein CsSME_00008032 [Camellia sinensis var. sinensis]
MVLVVFKDTSNDGQNDQLNWLMSTLEASNASWRIIAGFHSIVACDKNIEQMETKEAVEPLHRIFLKYGVNAYLSGQPCANSFHTDNDISNRGPVTKGPYFTTMHQRPVNYFVTLTGEVVDRLALQQWGKEAITEHLDKIYRMSPNYKLFSFPRYGPQQVLCFVPSPSGFLSLAWATKGVPCVRPTLLPSSWGRCGILASLVPTIGSNQ